MAQFFIVVAAIIWLSWQVWVVPMWESCDALTGDLEPRISDCTRLIEVSKWHPDLVGSTSFLYVRRGYHYLELRRFSEAVADASTALQYTHETSTDAVIALALRATASSSAGWFDRALEDLSNLVELEPMNVEVLVERGIVHRRLGDYEKALADYAMALQIQPNNASAYNSRAWALYLRGDLGEALIDADKAVGLSFQDPGAIDTRAHILLALGRKDEALADFIRLVTDGGVDVIRRYQQILTLRGYAAGSTQGEYSQELASSLKQCIEDGCKLAFDIELDQSNPGD